MAQKYRDEFCRKLTRLRQESRWPDIESFSIQVGLSVSGYSKCEMGHRIMSRKHLLRACELLRLNKEDADELLSLRDDQKAEQVGITRVIKKGGLEDPEATANLIQKEVSYVLKQAGIRVPASSEKVIKKRVALILKNAENR